MISIHALREEGDKTSAAARKLHERFLSTPSARRATYKNVRCNRYLGISIHALREEGDQMLPQKPTLKCIMSFLSTPSARRATISTRCVAFCKTISIHALREEGDLTFIAISATLKNFYPRPPRGGRPGVSICWSTAFNISIHALREEGDPSRRLKMCRHSVFLSTPSARRATAKTETKSLFSNKLYNILHEFRRALIYNGSKNYPNHAK